MESTIESLIKFFLTYLAFLFIVYTTNGMLPLWS